MEFVGNPTAKRGYLDGVILDDGQLRAGVGGGLCQLTNLIYWMTIHTPLTVVERWRHTYRIYEAAHVMTTEAPGVYLRHNIIRRAVLDQDGAEVGDELVTENHAQMMYAPFLPPGRGTN